MYDVAPLRQAIKHLDYSVYGGAPMLGVRGVSISVTEVVTARDQTR